MASHNLAVLDTSALLTLRSNEAGADRVEELLRRAEKTRRPVLVSFMTRMELLYIIWRREGELAARRAVGTLDAFPIEWISCEAEILEQAACLEARGGLSVADSWIAATAIVRGATLVHKDPEFEHIADISQQLLT